MARNSKLVGPFQVDPRVAQAFAAHMVGLMAVGEQEACAAFDRRDALIRQLPDAQRVHVVMVAHAMERSAERLPKAKRKAPARRAAGRPTLRAV